MARRVFFSFHYERDSWRAGQVRNSGAFKDIDDAGYWDHAKWEEVKKKGDSAISKWIDDALKGSSVTVVLIGKELQNRVGNDMKKHRRFRKFWFAGIFSSDLSGCLTI